SEGPDLQANPTLGSRMSSAAAPAKKHCASWALVSLVRTSIGSDRAKASQPSRHRTKASMVMIRRVRPPLATRTWTGQGSLDTGQSAALRTDPLKLLEAVDNRLEVFDAGLDEVRLKLRQKGRDLHAGTHRRVKRLNVGPDGDRDKIVALCAHPPAEIEGLHTRRSADPLADVAQDGE